MQKVLLFDDLDSDLPADETMTFVFDGQAYAVDLSAPNAKDFREAVEPYRAVARPLGKHKVSAAPQLKPARPAAAKKTTAPEVPTEWYKVTPGDSADVKAAKQEYRQRVRTWGNENDLVQGSRGTIPRHVYQAYEEWAAKNDVAIGPASVGL
jgi:hypothetical protein